MSRFTPGELSVMQILWEHGESKPSEIQERFPEPIKNPALRSYLTILVDKGHVSRRKVGKAYHYKAVTRQDSAFKQTLRELVNAYCSGSTEALLMNLLRAEDLTDDELLQLKRLAEEGEPASPPKKQKKSRK